MRVTLFIFILVVGHNCLADSLDEMRLYHNGTLLESIFVNKKKEVNISNANIGDTIIFEYLTDWGGEPMSKMEVKFESNKSEQLRSINNWGKFELILSERLIDKMIDVFVYSTNQYVPTWHCFQISFSKE